MIIKTKPEEEDKWIVFDMETWKILRRNRIVGSEIGTFQKHQSQSDHLVLPCLISGSSGRLAIRLGIVSQSPPSSPREETESVRRHHGDLIFEDLWKFGLTVSSGSQFGAQWLGYQGDPVGLHACCAVIIEPEKSSKTNLRAKDLSGFARVCHTAGKNAIISSESSTTMKSTFITLSWRP